MRRHQLRAALILVLSWTVFGALGAYLTCIIDTVLQPTLTV